VGEFEEGEVVADGDGTVGGASGGVLCPTKTAGNTTNEPSKKDQLAMNANDAVRQRVVFKVS
jgi:hypothetical protein